MSIANNSTMDVDLNHLAKVASANFLHCEAAILLFVISKNLGGWYLTTILFFQLWPIKVLVSIGNSWLPWYLPNGYSLFPTSFYIYYLEFYSKEEL